MKKVGKKEKKLYSNEVPEQNLVGGTISELAFILVFE